MNIKDNKEKIRLLSQKWGTLKEEERDVYYIELIKRMDENITKWTWKKRRNSEAAEGR